MDRRLMLGSGGGPQCQRILFALAHSAIEDHQPDGPDKRTPELRGHRHSLVNGDIWQGVCGFDAWHLYYTLTAGHSAVLNVGER
ncbi:hypothetical protein BAUCODRAFT_118431 [Baudoinia panamericana UAMH 10762]|uniref:Uncharacterized protein n=1 Tax=Baudoinia panamericana (strain UAMH 10762) TaxID=717646 RepID=M2N941_BAUPA|nr:uncharacterized protein BAUCODRAFT_118431 [Baudoinia panamericana UAMH 10762]EMD00679.1 hypothetical protein BAUCODRAFT_118431 [Baudoinia panamericana UAMH 10762]